MIRSTDPSKNVLKNPPPPKVHDKAVQSNILWLNLNNIGEIIILQSEHNQGNPSFHFHASGSKRRYPCTQTASAVPEYFPCLLQFCTGYRIWHAARVWKRKTLISTQLKISTYNRHFPLFLDEFLEADLRPIYCSRTASFGDEAHCLPPSFVQPGSVVYYSMRARICNSGWRRCHLWELDTSFFPGHLAVFLYCSKNFTTGNTRTLLLFLNQVHVRVGLFAQVCHLITPTASCGPCSKPSLINGTANCWRVQWLPCQHGNWTLLLRLLGLPQPTLWFVCHCESIHKSAKNSETNFQVTVWFNFSFKSVLSFDVCFVCVCVCVYVCAHACVCVCVCLIWLFLGGFA